MGLNPKTDEVALAFCSSDFDSVNFRPVCRVNERRLACLRADIVEEERRVDGTNTTYTYPVLRHFATLTSIMQ